VFLAEVALREAGNVPLGDAIGLLELYAATRDGKYEPAARRWLARYLVERQPTLEQLQLALSALENLRQQREPAMAVLVALSQ
jgi:2-polyprenyl-6-methoxyphenol hydroxylase-like FAD-dependent oxidoreductase